MKGGKLTLTTLPDARQAVFTFKLGEVGFRLDIHCSQDSLVANPDSYGTDRGVQPSNR